MSDETRIERVGRRKRVNRSLSAELIGVVGLLADEADESESGLLERAAWEHLVDEHGEERILELVNDVQDKLDDDDQLVDATREVIAT